MNPIFDSKKKTKKKVKTYLSYLVMAALLLLSQKSEAAVQIFTVTAGTVWNATNLFGTNKAFTITKVVIANTATGVTNLTYALLDFPGIAPANGWSATLRTNGGYMGIFQYLTNITKIVTNFGSGDGAGNYVTTTNTFTNAVFTYTNFVGATSNAWRVIGVGTVSSNSTATAIEGSFPVIYGLGFTNNNTGRDLTITVTYVPSL